MIDISIKLKTDHEVWDMLKSQSNALLSAGHIGTHIDVYMKSEIPEEYMERNGVIVDCTNYDKQNQIGLEVLDGIIIDNNDFVIFKTDIQKNHPYGSDIYINSHHQLSWEVIDHLISKKVSFIGIDCAGVRRGKEHYQADVKCEKNKSFIIENLDLSNLKSYNGERFLVYTIWINNPLSTGLSTRVLVRK